MSKGHDSAGPYDGSPLEATEFLASFHAGRTRGGYWKFWPASPAQAEKEAKEDNG